MQCFEREQPPITVIPNEGLARAQREGIPPYEMHKEKTNASVYEKEKMQNAVCNDLLVTDSRPAIDWDGFAITHKDSELSYYYIALNQSRVYQNLPPIA